MSHPFFEKILRKKFLREKIISKHQSQGPHDLIFILDHLKPGFNVAKIFRSANIFGVKEVLLIGIEHFDVRAAMGGFKNTHHKSFSNIEECLAYLSPLGYQVYALSPGGRESLPHTSLHTKCAFVVGHEEFGLSFDVAKFSQIAPLSIPQFGDVQSLNVSIAASIAGYEYLRQHIFSRQLSHESIDLK